MSSADPILTTPLHQMHLDADAKMVPFAGYEMPLQYPLGIKKEHLHTRENAGLFDVSHMGQIKLTGQNAKQALETLVPVDIVDLPLMKQRYAVFTNKKGGVMDDLMVTNIGDDGLFLVVNAACKVADFEHLKSLVDCGCEVELLEDVALLALQGPKSCEVLSKFAPSCSEMTFMTAKILKIDGVECLVTRSGYSGEDGFEISIPNNMVENFAKSLITKGAKPTGLGARDTLRLEAGLCLYGHDINETTTPIEANLKWAISKRRREEGGFLGYKKIKSDMNGKLSRLRIGIKPAGKIIARERTKIFSVDGQEIGLITSGTYGPSVNGPIAMGYVKYNFSKSGTKILLEVRGKKYEAKVSELPFYKKSYVR